jgi:hypothetical protein
VINPSDRRSRREKEKRGTVENKSSVNSYEQFFRWEQQKVEKEEMNSKKEAKGV